MESKQSKGNKLKSGVAAVTVGSVVAAGKKFCVTDTFKQCGGSKAFLAQGLKTLKDCLRTTVLWPLDQLKPAKVRQSAAKRGGGKGGSKDKSKLKRER